MKRWRFIPLVLAALIVAGCDPTNYSWSPDGRWMAVFTDGGLRLCDADGNLSPTTIPGVKVAAWFPDSKRVLVSREIEAKTWDEVAKYLSPKQLQEITDAAETARQALLAYDWNAPNADDWDKFGDAFTAKHPLTEQDKRVLNEYVGAIALYVRDHEDAQLRQTIPPDRQKELQSVTQSVQFLEVYGVDPFTATPIAQLMTTLQGINSLRVSPTGAAAIVVTSGDRAGDLLVLGTDGKHPAMQISDRAASSPDWSADGRDVVFIQAAQKPATGDAALLGSLSRVTVIGDNGAPLAKPAAAEDVAGLIYDQRSRVRCLKDGRIMFASAQVALPSTASDMPQRPQLFSVIPSNAATVNRVLSREVVETLGNSAEYFELSPDGQRVSIPDQTGKVDVVDLRSGEVITVQSKPVVSSADQNHQPALYTIPQWRSNDELTFMAPGDDGRPSLILWSISKKAGKTLSTNWPPGTTDSIAATQPATQP